MKEPDPIPDQFDETHVAVHQAVCAAELFVKIPTGQYIIALDKSQFFSRKEPFLELLHLGSPKTHTWHATTHTSFFS